MNEEKIWLQQKGHFSHPGQKGRCLSTTRGLSVHVPGQEGTLGRTPAHKGRAISGARRWEKGRGGGGGLCGRRGRETTSVVHSMHLVDVHNIYTNIIWYTLYIQKQLSGYRLCS